MLRLGALCIGEKFHHLDHLSYIAHWMGIPLLLSHESMLKRAQKFYPFVDISWKENWKAFKAESLVNEFDGLFYSNFYEFAPKANTVRSKKAPPFRCVYCPHGNSDKGMRSVWMEAFGDEDVCFVYGEQMKRFLKSKGVEDQGNWITTGNYRYAYYLKYRLHFDALAQREVFSHFAEELPIVLYAPTWKDLEGNTSFPEACEYLVQEKSPGWNLLIKLHPSLSNDYLAWMVHWIERCRNLPHVHVVEEFTPVYPLLSRTELYIGDMSSVGYDFLAFEKPLILLNPKVEKIGLCSVSTVVRREEFSSLNRIIEAGLANGANRDKLRDLYSFVFCEHQRSLEDIREEVFLKLSTPCLKH